MSAQSSKEVIIEAPMSYVGATKRIVRLITVQNQWVKWLVVIPLVVLALVCVYAFITCWYIAFGLLLVPYRLIRRSQRKQHQQMLQHNEIIDALQVKPGQNS